jgi:hypothetical protein
MTLICNNFKNYKLQLIENLPKPNLNPSANLELALWNTQALSTSLWNFEAASANLFEEKIINNINTCIKAY